MQEFFTLKCSGRFIRQQTNTDNTAAKLRNLQLSLIKKKNEKKKKKKEKKNEKEKTRTTVCSVLNRAELRRLRAAFGCPFLLLPSHITIHSFPRPWENITISKECFFLNVFSLSLNKI